MALRLSPITAAALANTAQKLNVNFGSDVSAADQSYFTSALNTLATDPNTSGFISYLENSPVTTDFNVLGQSLGPGLFAQTTPPSVETDGTGTINFGPASYGDHRLPTTTSTILNEAYTVIADTINKVPFDANGNPPRDHELGSTVADALGSQAGLRASENPNATFQDGLADSLNQVGEPNLETYFAQNGPYGKDPLSPNDTSFRDVMGATGVPGDLAQQALGAYNSSLNNIYQTEGANRTDASLDSAKGTGDMSQTADTGNAGDTNQTADAGDTNQTADAGDTNQTADAGDTNQTADAGDTNQTADAGDTNQTADAGDANQTADAGDANQTADTGDANQTADTGDANQTADTGDTNGAGASNGNPRCNFNRNQNNDNADKTSSSFGGSRFSQNTDKSMAFTPKADDAQKQKAA